ncbi:MAG: hypothetical protein Q9227_008858 [Pyrenula ochraceoflavens]
MVAPVAGMNFIKPFAGMQKKVTRDGQPAKRRGPKPDSKPAQTRRQELNRQAQRTHRERKEQYIKDLETAISTLRENYQHDISAANASLASFKEALKQQHNENKLLKQVLIEHGISPEGELDRRRNAAPPMPNTVPVSPDPPNTGIGNYQMVTPTSAVSTRLSPSTAPSSIPNGRGVNYSLSPSSGMSSYGYSPAEPGILEQTPVKADPSHVGVFEENPHLQIDFILKLETVCRDHAEYIVRKSHSSPDTPEEASFSGHALMASCPPPTHISTVPPQGNGLIPTYPLKVPDVPMPNLMTMLNLSKQLVAGSQVTPIMALQALKTHGLYHTLTEDDVKGMMESLDKKVRCYGFGAVMEEFELSDALHNIFATKPEYYEDVLDSEHVEEIEQMYG